MLIENTIFTNLVHNKEYFRVVWPHLKSEYFKDPVNSTIFKHFSKYVGKYNQPPSQKALKLMIDRDDKIGQTIHENSMSEVDSYEPVEGENVKWLIDESEKFCQDRAVIHALTKSAEIQDNSSKPEEFQDTRIPGMGTIPEILKEALGVSFDTNIGHDWAEDYESRYESYIEKPNKIPFVMDILNKITKYGVELGTLNIILAGVNVGKSLTLCSLAADYISLGYDVLYISMEMSAEQVSQRIDANMIDIAMDDFDTLTQTDYYNRIKSQIERKKLGKLLIKRYPTSAAGAQHFRTLLDELQVKKNWKPDVVIVDYLGICCSSRVKFSENSYHMVKAIAEELRGLAVEYNVACWSAAQTTRNGWDSSDISMSDTAESAGLPATADFMLALMETEELAEANEYLVKQIKSRYGDKNKNMRFRVGVDKGKQRIFEIDQEASQTTVQDVSKANQNQRAQNVLAQHKKSGRKNMDDYMQAEGIEFE